MAIDPIFAAFRGTIPCQPIGPKPRNSSGSKIIQMSSRFVE